MRHAAYFFNGLVCLICVSMNCFATTWYVNPGESIQDAIDSATHGDTVVVSPGTYFENIFFNGKNIVLTSTNPDSPAVVASTIIDASMSDDPVSVSVVRFDGSETTTCVLTGFTIQNGTGTNYYGGGICGNDCYTTIQNNTITDNLANYGGGLYGCHGTIQNNIITGNLAYWDGGGLYNCDGTIQNNTISRNLEGDGGGLSNCDGTIQNNTISENSTTHWGGGLAYCNAIIQDNTISYNSADWGGGLIWCDGIIRNNTITGNSATRGGGGLAWCDGTIRNNTISGNSAMLNGGGGLYYCGGTIHNNTISGNSTTSWGGGLAFCNGMTRNNTISGNVAVYGGGLFHCDGTIQNNTISGNSATSWGGGLCYCVGTIVNCIIWGNTALNGPQLYESSAPTYSCIQDWADTANENISSDPSFAGYPFDAWTWTHDAVYDSETFQTILIDITAEPYWEPGELAGMFINPNDTQQLQFYIVDNTDTTVTVWGDVRDIAHSRDAYEIYDYRLQAGSPCIDSGYKFANAGEYDLDGNPRYVDASDSSGWGGAIKAMVVDADDTVHLAWASIDMGAYEYQSVCTPLEFTLQSRDDLDSGSWQDRYSGFVGTWTDTEAVGVGKRFYRVIGDYAVEQSVVGISAQDALTMLDQQFGGPCFTVLDVRTPGEHGTRHIIGALNIDFYSPTFSDQLNALDKGRTYLVYCASGSRSGQAVQMMESMGFVEVYDLLSGMSAFQAVPGADAYLEP